MEKSMIEFTLFTLFYFRLEKSARIKKLKAKQVIRPQLSEKSGCFFKGLIIQST
jgi:hypothetical protein